MNKKHTRDGVNTDSKFKGFTPQTMPPVVLLQTALVCAVDDPKQWVKLTKKTAADLPRIAGLAAQLSSVDCFFCGHQFGSAMRLEEVERFHPEYPLCDCLLPLREEVARQTLEAAKALVQTKTEVTAVPAVPQAPVEEVPTVAIRRQPIEVPRWRSDPTGYVTAVASGEISDKSTAYEYSCRCGKKCAVVHGTVARDLREKKSHRVRTICHACFQAKMGREPKMGRDVKPSRLTQHLPKLPTLEELAGNMGTEGVSA